MKSTTQNFDEMTSEEVQGMTKEAFDALPFGTIRLDRHGTISVFNRWEAHLAHRKQAAVIGKNFFRDIAPCADVAEFRGRLEEMCRDGITTQIFDFVFSFPWGQRAVRVRFMIASEDERWVFITDVS